MFYCEFEYTNEMFKEKKIYQCKYCNMKLALENPDAKIICFKRQNEFFDNLDNIDKPENEQIHSEYYAAGVSLADVAKKKLNEKLNKNTESVTFKTSVADQNLCTKEQIDSRLNICSTCEHFRDNSCLLCGCVIVRDKNFNNKLAHKDANCPINKWGPVN